MTSIIRVPGNNRLGVSILAGVRGARIENLSVLDSYEDGVWVYGQVSFTGIQLHEHTTGIWVRGSAEVDIEDSVITDNVLGIYVSTDYPELEGLPRVSLKNSRISENEKGISVDSFTQASLINNAITFNKACGVHVDDTSIVIGWGNTISENGQDLCGAPDRLRRSLPPGAGSRTRVAVPDDTPSLQEAIDLIAEGGVVVLRAGEYTGGVEITKPLTLRGEGPDQTNLVTSSSTGITIAFMAEPGQVQIEDMSLAGEMSGILARGAIDLDLSNVSINLDSGNGIVVQFARKVTLQKIRIFMEGKFSTGVIIRGSIQCDFNDGEIYMRNQCSSGIIVDNHAVVQLNNIKILASVMLETGEWLRDWRQMGIWVEDQAELTAKNMHISGLGGDYTVAVRGLAKVTILDSNFVDNIPHVALINAEDQSSLEIVRTNIYNYNIPDTIWITLGIELTGQSRGNVADSRISGAYTGLHLGNLAQLTVNNSTISDNFDGIEITDSAQAVLSNCIVSGNLYNGIRVERSALIVMHSFKIKSNGKHADCQKTYSMCNGIEMWDESRAIVINSIIFDNTDWGIAAFLEQCGFAEDLKHLPESKYTGQVAFEEMELENISGNNKSGNQTHLGNPGNHPWNRPDVPDGQVCLP